MKKNRKTQSHFDETDQMALLLISTAKCDTFFVSRIRVVCGWMQRKKMTLPVEWQKID